MKPPLILSCLFGVFAYVVSTSIGTAFYVVCISWLMLVILAAMAKSSLGQAFLCVVGLSAIVAMLGLGDGNGDGDSGSDM